MLAGMVEPERLPAHELRISDADRERVSEVLRNASAEGRLDLTELDERLGRVYAAKTFADLEPLLRDLPTSSGMAVPMVGVEPVEKGRQTTRWAVALMGGFHRTGRWAAPRRLNCVAICGGGTIDLREAQFEGGLINIRVFAIMGGATVIVGEDADLHVNGVGIMGGFDPGASGAGAPGGPRVVVGGLAIMGGVAVKRRQIKGKW